MGVPQTITQEASIDLRRTVNGFSTWLVSAEDLILLKLLANRQRDLLDVGDILFTQGQLDEVYLRKWAETLHISERLERALADKLQKKEPPCSTDVK